MASTSAIDAAAGDGAIEIGIIGMGDMGRLYATKFQQAGWM